MRTRGLIVVLLCAAPARADRPVELPPLLTPTDPCAPAAAPRGPVGEYDHGHLYLPEKAPPQPPASQPPEVVRPLGKWWLNPSLDLAWASRDTPLPTMQLRVPGVRNSPVVPLEGVTADSFRVGVSVTGGWWCGDRQMNGIDAGFSLLGTGDRTVTGVAPGVLFVFPDGPSKSAPQVVAFPEPAAGTFYGTFPATYSTWFVGADVNYRRGLVREPNLRLDAVAGYRFAYVADELFLGESPTEGDDYRRNRFAVTNQFHGGQVGVVGECTADVWSVSGSAKVALGSVTSNISESGLFTNPDVYSGGSFAALTNRCVGSRFAVLPSVSATVGRKWGERGHVYVGYSFQYLNNVVRLGDVLDPATNGGAVRVTDYTVQAVRLGWEWRY